MGYLLSPYTYGPGLGGLEYLTWHCWQDTNCSPGPSAGSEYLVDSTAFVPRILVSFRCLLCLALQLSVKAVCSWEVYLSNNGQNFTARPSWS